MGYELTYQASLRGTTADKLASEIEDNENYLERIEQDIFALICMDPSKVRRDKKKSNGNEEDEEEYAWMNNAQYLAKMWDDLKEQWKETMEKLIRCSQAQAALDDKTRWVRLCPDCMVEVKCDYNHETYKWEDKCPKCGKVYEMRPYVKNGEEDKNKGPFAVEAEVSTWHESY